MTLPTVEILPDKPALVARALDLTVEIIQAAIAQQGYCTLALAGGSTPKPLYAALAQQDLPWERLHVFWGDERYVPVDHPDSNAGMAKAAWLDAVAIPPEQVYVAPTAAGDVAADAATYEATLRQAFQQLTGDATAFPTFDLILLGMGDDGHTASLFPHTPALAVTNRLVTVGNKGDNPRLTFTVPLINQGRQVLFLAAGANKQYALSQVFGPAAADAAFPSRLIQPAGTLRWLLDGAAGLPLLGQTVAAP